VIYIQDALNPIMSVLLGRRIVPPLGIDHRTKLTKAILPFFVWGFGQRILHISTDKDELIFSIPFANRRMIPFTKSKGNPACLGVKHRLMANKISLNEAGNRDDALCRFIAKSSL
jgi:hypothetical protein